LGPEPGGPRVDVYLHAARSVWRYGGARPGRRRVRPAMTCPRCHAENREGRRFCAKCAAPLATVCPACGFSNEPGEDFCGGCAAPLAAASRPVEPRFDAPESYTPKHLAEKILTSKAAHEGERKQVTVLFADLKGSMELLADRDPEEA